MTRRAIAFLGRRSVVVMAGLSLVLVPTLFSVFPCMTTWSAAVRGLIVAGWVAAALIVVVGTARQGELVEDIAGRTRERRERRRELSGARLMDLLLQPKAAGFPAHYEFRVFVPDKEHRSLVPLFEPTGVAAAQAWDVGRGATGAAWERDEYVLAYGAAASDSTHGLTPEEQERYRDLKVVGAIPIRNAHGDPIAILSASSETNAAALATPAGKPVADGTNKLQELAEVLARVLIDVLGVGRD